MEPKLPSVLTHHLITAQTSLLPSTTPNSAPWKKTEHGEAPPSHAKPANLQTSSELPMAPALTTSQSQQNQQPLLAQPSITANPTPIVNLSNCAMRANASINAQSSNAAGHASTANARGLKNVGLISSVTRGRLVWMVTVLAIQLTSLLTSAQLLNLLKLSNATTPGQIWRIARFSTTFGLLIHYSVGWRLMGQGSTSLEAAKPAWMHPSNTTLMCPAMRFLSSVRPVNSAVGTTVWGLCALMMRIAHMIGRYAAVALVRIHAYIWDALDASMGNAIMSSLSSNALMMVIVQDKGKLAWGWNVWMNVWLLLVRPTIRARGVNARLYDVA